MNIPAIRDKRGIWVYYMASLSFADIAKYAHEEETDEETIAASEDISKYLRARKEDNFLPPLILAVNGGDPEWQGFRLEYEDGTEFHDIGYLKLRGDEKMIQVDRKGRVMGIKDALKKDPSLATEKTPVMFIGHKE